MVCLGNICRSPLAEGILKAKISEKNLNWKVDSAGTIGHHAGELPDHRSIKIAKKYGLDITDQRSRKLTLQDLDVFDKIYVMDSNNYNDVIALCKNLEQKNKVEIIMNMVQPGRNIAVPDPYWDDNGFEKVYQMLEEACEVICKMPKL